MAAAGVGLRDSGVEVPQGCWIRFQGGDGAEVAPAQVGGGQGLEESGVGRLASVCRGSALLYR